jgi:uncharacterized membrane protein
MRAVRILLLIGCSLTAAIYSHVRVLRLTSQFGDVPKIEAGREDQPAKSAFDRMSKENETLANFAVILLSAVAALVISTKVHKISHVSWAYLLFGPAGTFLFYSAYAGWAFQARHAFLTLRNNFTDFASVNDLLLAQLDLFRFALVFLAVVAAVFLVQIVGDRVSPTAPP